MQIPVKKRAIQKPNAEYFQLCGNLEEGKPWGSRKIGCWGLDGQAQNGNFGGSLETFYMIHCNGGYTSSISKPKYHTAPRVNLGRYYVLGMILIRPLSNSDISCRTLSTRKALDVWCKSDMGNLSVPFILNIKLSVSKFA